MLKSLNDVGVMALVGIVLGWLLSSISATLRFRNERKADLCTVLSRMLPALLNMSSLRHAVEGFKDTAKSWGDYEPIRIRIWQRHGDVFSQESSSDLEGLVDKLAKHRPILAIRLRNVIHMHGKIRQSSLASTVVKSEEAYLKLLSAQEVARDAIASELEKIVRSLAWSASLWQGISFELYWARRGGGPTLRQKNTDFLKSFRLDVWSDVTSTSSDETSRN